MESYLISIDTTPNQDGTKEMRVSVIGHDLDTLADVQAVLNDLESLKKILMNQSTVH